MPSICVITRSRRLALTCVISVKFFKNVALPYDARIIPTIDELNDCMRKVKERVDVHNTHRLAAVQYDISALIGILDDNRKLQVNSHAIITPLLHGIASDKMKEMDQPVEYCSKDTYASIKANVSRTISSPGEASSAPFPTLPNLQLTFEHLKDCAIQSVRLEADQSYLALDLPNKPEVKAWLKSNRSTLLWIDGFANSRASKWTTEFSVDVLLGAERQSSTVLFYFGDIATNDVAEASSSYLASSKAIIHSFIVQLLRQHISLAGNDTAWLTSERWTEARRSTRAAWSLLYHLLQSLSAEARVVYLIIDSIDALSSVNDHTCELQPLLRRLSASVTSSPSGENKRSNPSFAVKVLLTSVAGNTHSFLFPPTAASPLPGHSIVHVPQTFGQHNVASAPSHLRKPSAKHLVRLPDSDDEFGLKPADSFGFSDEEDEDLAFSSDEEMDNSQGANDRGKEGRGELHMEDRMAQHSPRMVRRTSLRSESGSSEELDFSENETEKRKVKEEDDDIQFSSASEEESNMMLRSGQEYSGIPIPQPRLACRGLLRSYLSGRLRI